MADIRISQLPSAPSAITGSELVPIVQNGQTVQTTVYNLVNSPTQTQTYLTVNNEPSLPNSRRIGGGTGIGVTDGGALGQLLIGLNAVSGSLESASQGIIVKNSSTTVTNRSIAVSGAGLSVANATGVSGNPTLALTGLALALTAVTATGFLTTAGGTTLTPVSIVGTSNQITVVGGDGSSTPTISIANNPTIGGTGAITLPIGTTAQRSGTAGALRYNSDLGTFEGYTSGGWTSVANEGVSSFQTSLSGLTPGSSSTGAITLAGTLNPSSGGTGANTLTGYVYGNGTSTMTASTTIPVSALSGTLGVSAGGTGAVSLTGILKGNGTSAISTATSGTDYAPPTSGSSILYGNGAGGFSNVTIGTGLSFAGGTLSTTATSGTVTSVSVATANGFAGSVASATTTPVITLSTSVNGIVKGTGSGITVATSGTDYSAGTSGLASGIVYSTTSTGALSIASATNINNTFGSQSGNYFYASPSSGSGTPTFRAIAVGDIPTLNQNTTGSAGSATNIIGGVANQIAYQTGVSTTGFITAPSSANTFLSWTGSGFTWTASASSGVTQIVAGTNVTISPTGGTGVVTINASGGGGGTPGGLNTNVQYNSAGSFAGTGTFTFDGTILKAPTLNLTNALGSSYGGTGLTSIGTAGQALVVNGTATGLQWSTIVSSPAGSDTQVQFNSSGSFAGSANLTFNGTTLTANTLNLTNALSASYGGTGTTTSTGSGSNVLGTRPTLTVTGAGFTLQDATDNTKQANFNLSGISTGNTRTYTLPDVSTNLVVTGNVTQTFVGTTSFSPQNSTGTFSVGATAQTGTITLGLSTVTQTTNIQAGATASGSTKTINLGTNGLAGSTTNITIGSTTGTSTTNLQGVLQLSSSAGTSGQVLTSQGTGAVPTWTTVSGGSSLPLQQVRFTQSFGGF